MVIHYTHIYNNVVFPGNKACIFIFKGRKSCANGDSVTLEFMLCARSQARTHKTIHAHTRLLHT